MYTSQSVIDKEKAKSTKAVVAAALTREAHLIRNVIAYTDLTCRMHKEKENQTDAKDHCESRNCDRVSKKSPCNQHKADGHIIGRLIYLAGKVKGDLDKYKAGFYEILGCPSK